MKSTTWMDLAQLIGIAGILATLVILVIEIQQSQDFARAQWGSNILASANSVNSAIIDNPDVWVRGNAGEELSPSEQVIFSRLVNNQIQRAYWSNYQYEYIEGETSLIIVELVAYLYENPGAYLAWRDRIEYLSKYRQLSYPDMQVDTGFIVLIEEHLSRYRQAEATAE